MENTGGFYRVDLGPERWASLCISQIESIFGVEASSIEVTVSKAPFKGSQRIKLYDNADSLCVHGKGFYTHLTGASTKTVRRDFGSVKQLYVRIVPCKSN